MQAGNGPLAREYIRNVVTQSMTRATQTLQLIGICALLHLRTVTMNYCTRITFTRDDKFWYFSRLTVHFFNNGRTTACKTCFHHIFNALQSISNFICNSNTLDKRIFTDVVVWVLTSVPAKSGANILIFDFSCLPLILMRMLSLSC